MGFTDTIRTLSRIRDEVFCGNSKLFLGGWQVDRFLNTINKAFPTGGIGEGGEGVGWCKTPLAENYLILPNLEKSCLSRLLSPNLYPPAKWQKLIFSCIHCSSIIFILTSYSVHTAVSVDVNLCSVFTECYF